LSEALIAVLKAAALAVALSHPRPWYPSTYEQRESPARYERRVGVLVEAAVRVGGNPPTNWRWSRNALIAGILAHWRDESKFAYEVHGGWRHPVWHQDHGRARCLGQHQASGVMPRARWRKLAGVDLAASMRCARATAEALARMRPSCAPHGMTNDGIIALFSAMWGRGCEHTSAGQRKAHLFGRYFRALQKNAPAPYWRPAR
jgi:hypothetical protein